MKQGFLKIGNRASVPLLTTTQSVPLDCNAIPARPFTVPEKSQMTVLARVQPTIGVTDLYSDYAAVIEPGPSNGQGLLAARTVALVQARMTYIRVMNPRTFDLHAYPSDTMLGSLYCVGQDSRCDYCIIDKEVDVLAIAAGLPEQQTYLTLTSITQPLPLTSNSSFSP